MLLMSEFDSKPFSGFAGQQVAIRASKVDSKKLPRQKARKKRRISEPGSGDTFVIDLDTGSEPGHLPSGYCPSLLGR